MTESCVLDVKHVTKHFRIRRSLRDLVLRPFGCRGTFTALEDVSFSVPPGEIVGVVGENGAGKSTLMRIIADLIQPDLGVIRINGYDRSGKATSRMTIGYAPTDERSFFWRLSGMENLYFFASLHGMSRRDTDAVARPLVDELGLAGKARVPFRDYSTGTRKKLGLIRALLHRPRVLLLDEITNSLDPESSQKAKEIVRRYVTEHPNAAVLWSTHRLEETAELCDRVLVLEKGRARSFEPVGGVGKSVRSRYLLQVRNLEDRLDEFAGECSAISNFRHLRMHNVNEFVFEDVTPTIFGRIITMAVTEYDAQVSFAGCVPQKERMV